MIDAVTDSQTEEMSATLHTRSAPLAYKPQPRMRFWTVFSSVVIVGLMLCAIAVYGGRRIYKNQRYALKVMREGVEASTAPGEAVVVDDKLLAWALRRGSDGVLKDSVWTVPENVSAASLLDRLAKTGRREMVVVATPDDGLIHSLDAAGFTVAQEVGWVPWDVGGTGRSLLGRGKKRIYFAVAPRIAVAPRSAVAPISSKAKVTR
jgi:hypothetical protein